MTTVTHEDDVARLFAESNPIPATVSPGLRPRPVGADPTSHVEVARVTTRPRRTLLAVAATVVVALGAALALRPDLGDDQVTTPIVDADDRVGTVDDGGAATPSREVAETWLAAWAAHDPAAVRSVSSPGLGVVLASTHDPLAQEWFEPLQWTERTSLDEAVAMADLDDRFAVELALGRDWRVDHCGVDPDDDGLVVCRARRTDALTGARGAAPVEVDVTLVVEGGVVIAAELLADVIDWDREVWRPFVVWVLERDAATIDTMWEIEPTEERTHDYAVPHTDGEAVTAFERLVVDYVEAGAPDPMSMRFVAALHGDGPDVEAGLGLLAIDATVDGLWVETPSDYRFAAPIWAAMGGWDWQPTSCGVAPEAAGGTAVRCWLRPDENDPFGLPILILHLEVADGRITSIAVVDSTSPAEVRAASGVEAFADWLRAEHPDEVDAMVTEHDGVLVPVLDEASVERWGRLAPEYLTAGG